MCGSMQISARLLRSVSGWVPNGSQTVVTHIRKEQQHCRRLEPILIWSVRTICPCLNFEAFFFSLLLLHILFRVFFF